MGALDSSDKLLFINKELPCCPQERWLQVWTANWEDFAISSPSGAMDLQEAQVPLGQAACFSTHQFHLVCILRYIPVERPSYYFLPFFFLLQDESNGTSSSRLPKPEMNGERRLGALRLARRYCSVSVPAILGSHRLFSPHTALCCLACCR